MGGSNSYCIHGLFFITLFASFKYSIFTGYSDAKKCPHTTFMSKIALAKKKRTHGPCSRTRCSLGSTLHSTLWSLLIDTEMWTVTPSPTHIPDAYSVAKYWFLPFSFLRWWLTITKEPWAWFDDWVNGLTTFGKAAVLISNCRKTTDMKSGAGVVPVRDQRSANVLLLPHQPCFSCPGWILRLGAISLTKV